MMNGKSCHRHLFFNFYVNAQDCVIHMSVLKGVLNGAVVKISWLIHYFVNIDEKNTAEWVAMF